MCSLSRGRRLYGLAAVLFLAACGGSETGSATLPWGTSPLVLKRTSSGSYGYCPANPGGTGILPDGDFSLGLNDGDHFTEPHKGTVFAPYWKVSKRNIDFNGTTFWDMDGYCSIDLDGNNAGGVTTSAFPTKPGASYTVSFLLSGNGGQGKGNPPVVKTMVITAASQFQTFIWDTSNDNDVEHGKSTKESWVFEARRDTTTLKFTSQDPHASSRGAVIAALVVTKNSRVPSKKKAPD